MISLWQSGCITIIYPAFLASSYAGVAAAGGARITDVKGEGGIWIQWNEMMDWNGME